MHIWELFNEYYGMKVGFSMLVTAIYFHLSTFPAETVRALQRTLYRIHEHVHYNRTHSEALEPCYD